VKKAAIFFHRQNVQSCAQEEHQLVPYVGWSRSYEGRQCRGAAFILEKSLGVVMMFCLELCLSRISLGSFFYLSHGGLLFLHMFPLRSYAGIGYV
jgi:hypothetical protein